MNDLVENPFCAAILKILENHPVTENFHVINMDGIRYDFKCNGQMQWKDHKYDDDDNDDQEYTKRPLFLNTRSKLSKVSKKIQKVEMLSRTHCRFCENNQEKPDVYTSHSLRDSAGRLTCPRLRKYVCPICGAKGDNAHTVRYCTKKPVYMINEGKCDSGNKEACEHVFELPST